MHAYFFFHTLLGLASLFIVAGLIHFLTIIFGIPTEQALPFIRPLVALVGIKFIWSLLKTMQQMIKRMYIEPVYTPGNVFAILCMLPNDSYLEKLVFTSLSVQIITTILLFGLTFMLRKNMIHKRYLFLTDLSQYIDSQPLDLNATIIDLGKPVYAEKIKEEIKNEKTEAYYLIKSSNKLIRFFVPTMVMIKKADIAL